MNWVHIPATITIIQSPAIIGDQYFITNNTSCSNNYYSWVLPLNQIVCENFRDPSQVTIWAITFWSLKVGSFLEANKSWELELLLLKIKIRNFWEFRNIWLQIDFLFYSGTLNFIRTHIALIQNPEKLFQRLAIKYKQAHRCAVGTRLNQCSQNFKEKLVIVLLNQLFLTFRFKDMKSLYGTINANFHY